MLKTLTASGRERWKAYVLTQTRSPGPNGQIDIQSSPLSDWERQADQSIHGRSAEDTMPELRVEARKFGSKKTSNKATAIIMER